MRVRVSFMGPLAEYTKANMVDIELPQGATFRELLNEIHCRFGNSLPERIWDGQARTFKAGILVVGSGRDLDDPETGLKEGEEIKVVPILAGG